MRILHVITMLDVGGAERLIADLLPRLRDKGHQVDLLLFNGVDTALKNYITQLGISIFELSHGKDVYKFFWDVYNPWHIVQFRQYLKKYDIIHTHNTACQLYVPLSRLLKCSKVSLVTTEHSPSNRRRSKWWFKPVDKWMYNQYDSIICIADKTRNNLEEYIGKKNNIVTICNGVDVKRFIKPIKDVSSQERFVITMVAGLRAEKDHETLFKAITMLPENYSLQIVGGGVKEQSLKSLCERMQLSNRVSFMGVRSDVPDILEKSDILVLSSHWEGLSLSSIEGMASGRPFIASDVDGLREMVGGAGVLFPHGDSKALAQNIQFLCEHPDEYCAVAKRCQEKAKLYDISVMTEKYLQLYERLI
jgi:glycosyltransferase involved in cell wall biosynthesis